MPAGPCAPWRHSDPPPLLDAQLLAFFVLPALGSLSDRVGRRPILLARAALVAILSGCVAAKPSYAFGPAPSFPC